MFDNWHFMGYFFNAGSHVKRNKTNEKFDIVFIYLQKLFSEHVIHKMNYLKMVLYSIRKEFFEIGYFFDAIFC